MTQRRNTQSRRQPVSGRQPAQRRQPLPGRQPVYGRQPAPGRRPSPGRQTAERRRPRRKGAWKRLLLIPVAALLLWLALNRWVFVIRGVDISGAGDIPAADVVRLSGIPLGGRLSAVDETAIRSRVESDGRLAFVSLEKKYPTRLVLTVRPRSRDAFILQAGKLVVLDSDGYVVSVGDVTPEDGMPYVMGLRASNCQLGRRLDAPDDRLDALKTVLEALKARNATGYVSEINLERLGDIELIARKGIVVSLGNSENMGNKVLWMAGALADLEARGETLGRLDVSSGSKADFLSGATPTPAPTPTPVPEVTPEIVIGEDAI